MKRETKPGIVLTHKRVACRVHGEPFRVAWPKGWAIFGMTLLKRVLKDESIAKDAGRDVSKVGEILDERPACYLVPDSVLREAYEASGVGVEGRCVACGEDRLGTPVKVIPTIGADPVDVPHVCFECVLTRECER